jgi:hypothetical protein
MARTKDLFTLELSYRDGQYNRERQLLVASLPQAIEIASRIVEEGCDYTLTFRSRENKKVCYGKKED